MVGSHVGDTVLVHDLGATKLQVGSVDLATEQFVNGRSTSEDDGLTLDLDGTLTKTDEIGADTDGTAGDERNGEDVFVGTGSLTSDETRTLQTLYTKTVLGTNDGGDLVAGFAALLDLLGDDIAPLLVLEERLLLRSEVQVLETKLRLLRVPPRDREVGNKLLGHADTSTRVGREVDTRNAKLTGKLRALVEEGIFFGTERTNLEGDVVGNDDKATTTGVLRGLRSDDPSDHADRVGTRLTVDLSKIVRIINDKLIVFNALALDRCSVPKMWVL